MSKMLVFTFITLLGFSLIYYAGQNTSYDQQEPLSTFLPSLGNLYGSTAVAAQQMAVANSEAVEIEVAPVNHGGALPTPRAGWNPVVTPEPSRRGDVGAEVAAAVAPLADNVESSAMTKVRLSSDVRSRPHANPGVNDPSNPSLPLRDIAWWNSTYPDAVSRIVDFPWVISSWWSDFFPVQMNNLIRDVLATGRNITIATLGGSASSYVPPMYMHHMANELQELLDRLRYNEKVPAPRINCVNPSAGNTGSEWAALLMDSLLPVKTDILFWEFTINDWMMDSVTGISKETRRRQVFELFLHRAWALNPNMIVGVVSLWPPGAAQYCWPCNSWGSQGYDNIMTIARCYLKEPLFTMDFRLWFAARRFKKTNLFRDGHHPNDNGYREIGRGLYTHVLNALITPGATPRQPRRENQMCLPEQKGTSAQSARGLPLPTFSLGKAAANNPLLSRLWDSRFHLVSTQYDANRFHGITSTLVMQTTAHEALEAGGKAYEHRTDRKKMIMVPVCSESNDIMYRVSAGRPDFRFVGLNLRKPDGSFLARTPTSFDDINLTISSPVRLRMKGISTVDMRGSMQAACLTRGPIAPQAFFSTGSRAVQFPLELSLCSRRSAALGSLVFA